MWEVIITNLYQLSVPYVARYVKMELELLLEIGRPIQERTFDLSVPGAGAVMPAAGGSWRSVERISIIAPPGIQFWDPAFDMQINDGLTVKAYPQAARRPATTAFYRDGISIEVSATQLP